MSTPPLTGRRVLVVEDEMMVAMLIEDALTDRGYELVGPATRVAHAMHLLDEQPVDVALLDVNLNGEETYPIADELTRRGVPFVFATGYGSAGIRTGYNHHPTLQKPFQESDLADALERVLRQERR